MNRKDFIKSLFGVPALILANNTSNISSNNTVAKDVVFYNKLSLDLKGNIGLGPNPSSYPLHVYYPNEN
jgi:hypothetical protein